MQQDEDDEASRVSWSTIASQIQQASYLKLSMFALCIGSSARSCTMQCKTSLKSTPVMPFISQHIVKVLNFEAVDFETVKDLIILACHEKFFPLGELL